MNIAPIPITRFFVDEAGHPKFKANDKIVPFVLCGVAIPADQEAAIEFRLPRSGDGRILKSSDIEFSDALAASFVDDLLRTTSIVVIRTIDSTHSKSIAAAEIATARANLTRRGRRDPKISTPGFVYLFLASMTIIDLWLAASSAYGTRLSYIDVTFDTSCLRDTDEQLMREQLTAILRKYEVVAREMAWRTETAEPLLTASDIVAGIIHRRATRSDCPKAWSVLESAIKRGRVAIEHGYKFKTL